jgi:plasmid stabilization system protein ParE
VNVRRFHFLTLPLLAGALVAATGCKVRYRRDVEAPGTPARYTVAAGGFMRYDGYDDVAGDLQVASRDYVKPGSGVRIRLVGAIHIGDLEYYRTLQKELLDPADVVLFEGVKYEGGEEPPDLGGLYSSIGEILGLGFQKDGIDYHAKNFVHCDVTVHPGDPLAQTVDAKQMNQAASMIGSLAQAKMMLAQGPAARQTEDALKHQMVTVMAAQMGGMSDEQAEEQLKKQFGGGEDGEVPDALRQRVEKAAKQLKKLGGPNMPEFGGMSEEMKREILEKRNAYVLERLRERLDEAESGPQQTIAIFYGAAHLPGMEKQIEAWGYRPVETTWLRAWRMNTAGGPVVAERIAAGGGPVATAPAPSPAPRRAHGEKEPTLY